MKSEPIIADIARGVNIWEGVRQEINCFGKRLIEALLKEELLSHLGRRVYERLPQSRSQRRCFHIPLKERKHRSKLKTVNKLESFFRELRRRINNVGTFENVKSLERHLFALIIINKTKQDTPYMLFTQNS